LKRIGAEKPGNEKSESSVTRATHVWKIKRRRKR